MRGLTVWFMVYMVMAGVVSTWRLIQSERGYRRAMQSLSDRLHGEVIRDLTGVEELTFEVFAGSLFIGDQTPTEVYLSPAGWASLMQDLAKERGAANTWTVLGDPVALYRDLRRLGVVFIWEGIVKLTVPEVDDQLGARGAVKRPGAHGFDVVRLGDTDG